MPVRRLLTLLLYTLWAMTAAAQRTPASVVGKVTDAEGRPLAGSSVIMLGRVNGQVTDDSGQFRMSVPSEKAFALLFSHAGYRTHQSNFNLRPGAIERIEILLSKDSIRLKEIVVTAASDRREAGLIRLNAAAAQALPSITGGIEALIKIFVGSNNELTSQYAVRGGNYDENLVYVNDFEVFRPYLVRSGQQEGLSFINPELAGRIQFYNGGFQARYGDKISSVLDVSYRKPTRFGGSLSLGVLEQGLHVEGAGKKQRFSYLVGARSRTNRSILAAQEVKGSYIPSSSDVQALFNARLNDRWEAELLANLSDTDFEFLPRTAQLTSSVFSPFLSANLGMDIFFEGREEDRYRTSMVGLSATRRQSNRMKLKWMASGFYNGEKESFDITGYYLFGDRSFDRSRPDFGQITNPLGVGGYQRFARNRLEIRNVQLGHRGEWAISAGHLARWGLNLDQTSIEDRLNEWVRKDSTGYTLPRSSGQLRLSEVIKSSNHLELHRWSGFLQDNMHFTRQRDITLQAGLRFQYNTLNREWLVSPRFSASMLSKKIKDLIWRVALGAYHQPPFYRELRRPDGIVHPGLQAQRSWQAVAGADWQFRWHDRPFRLTSEAYYKQLSNVVSYDIDNVRIRYSGRNDARAMAAGLEFRIAGEWVKDAESWVSLGFMRTLENLFDDRYYIFFDRNGKPFGIGSPDPYPTDSVLQQKGWLRRPTDRLVTLGIFFQDYLSTNRNVRVYLSTIAGSNMPFNIPGSVKYRNALVIEPYIRADVGFSALLYDAQSPKRRRKVPGLQNCWASLELFNMLDRRNTISYELVKDFSNTVFTMPNRLTPRLLNLKATLRF